MNPTTPEVLSCLMQFIKTLIKDPAFELKPDTALIANGLLDSFQILSVIEFVEKNFAIPSLTENDLHPDHFASVQAMAQLIQGKLR